MTGGGGRGSAPAEGAGRSGQGRVGQRAPPGAGTARWRPLAGAGSGSSGTLPAAGEGELREFQGKKKTKPAQTVLSLGWRLPGRAARLRRSLAASSFMFFSG